MAEEEDKNLEEDSAGYLMSVSDMMSGLLFIFIVTLTAFIISFQAARNEFQEARARKEKTVQQLTDAQVVRREMLLQIQETLRKEYGIGVRVDPEHRILRLTDKALTFPSGEAELPPEELTQLKAIGRVLAKVVPCYASNPPKRCDPGKQGELEATFVEGHTDNVPVGESKYQDNLELSTARAAFTYRRLTNFQPVLGQIKNRQGQPIFSVSGYGAKRPVMNCFRSYRSTS